MDFRRRETKDTLAFLDARAAIAVDRKIYDERVAALQRLMRDTQTPFPPASPAAMQLALLENPNLLLADPVDDAARQQAEDALKLASTKLSEKVEFTLRLRNEFVVAWPQFYLVFETRMLLWLAALKPRAPMTNIGCNSVRSFILSRPALAMLVKQLESELTAAAHRLFNQPYVDALVHSAAERDYRLVSRRAITAVTDIYRAALPPDVPPFDLHFDNPMVDKEHSEMPLLVDVAPQQQQPVTPVASADFVDNPAFD
jgi:hypothetical protein